jgi:hypothetical protein
MAATDLSNLSASAVRVDGGYRVDGWRDYGSGCDTATHFIGAIDVAGADGQSPADTRWAAFPRASTASSTTGTRSACAGPVRSSAASATST